jgi:hypothetical protein
MLLLEPFESAWRHMRLTLFDPFRVKKWFAWGLLAFIGANIQHGGGFPNIFSFLHDEAQRRSDSFAGGGLPAEAIPGDPSTWFGGNWWLIGGAIAGVALVVLVIALLWTYLMSRGRFMFVECLVENKSAIRESWRRNGAPALSLFWWYIGFSAFVILLLLLAGVTVFLTLFRDGQLAPFAEIWPRLLAVGAAALLAIVPLVAVGIFLEDFVVPIMWHRRLRVLEAWNAFFSLFQEHMGACLLYLLLRLGLSLAAGLVMGCGVCLTCCIAALPIIGQTLLLPIYVVMRMYPVMVLAQVEPGLADRLAALAAPPPAPPAPPSVPPPVEPVAPAPEEPPAGAPADPPKDAPADDADKPSP